MRGQKAIVCCITAFALNVVVSISGQAETLCHIALPQDKTVGVAKSPESPVIATLPAESMIRLDETEKATSGRTWARIAGVYKGDWRNWGWVPRDTLKCMETDDLQRERPSVATLRAGGIVPQSVRKGPKLAIECSLIPNEWGVTFGHELFEVYRQRGFSEDAACLGLGGNGIYFDPETGQPLKLYMVANDIFSLRAAWLPDCYRSVEITGRGGYLVGWRPTGCTLKYHPSTGIPITQPLLVELSAGGEAGGGVDEDNRSTTVSEDRLRSLLLGK